MEKELIKYILEIIGEDDCVCTELHQNENEEDYCRRNCVILNENCIKRLMYNRLLKE